MTKDVRVYLADILECVDKIERFTAGRGDHRCDLARTDLGHGFHIPLGARTSSPPPLASGWVTIAGRGSRVDRTSGYEPGMMAPSNMPTSWSSTRYAESPA